MATRRTVGRVGAFLGAAVLLLLWGAAPAWAAPAVTVTPSTDLVDGQSVSVSGSGFAANTFIGVAMCRANPRSIDDCDLSPLVTLTTDGAGSFATGFEVRRFISLFDRNLDCATAPGACVVVAGEPDFDPVATAPLSFDPDAPTIPPLDMTFTLDARAVIDRRTGAAVLTGTATCTREAEVSLFGSLTQATLRGVASGGFSGLGRCDEDGEIVVVVVEPSEGTFRTGLAAAQVSATAFDAGDFVSRQASSTVLLTSSK